MGRHAFRELASAYDGFEAPERFESLGALDAYRAELLDRSSHQADFLQRFLPEPGRVLEAACGNGRLLVELARRGALDNGLGVDLAESRIEFARNWAEKEGCRQLEFLAADILETDLEGEFDMALCITGAFNYFETASTGSAGRLAGHLASCLARDGLLCLELYCHSEHLRLIRGQSSGELQTWQEMPESDPWRYYLSRLSLEGERILSHEKIFVHRDSGEIDTGRRERLYLYSDAEIRELLASAGFERIECRQGWSEDPYSDGELMVVTAHAG